MIRSMQKNGAILAGVALVCTGIVALTHTLTKDAIAQQQAEKLLSLLNQVVPQTLYDNALAQECRLVQSDELGTDQPMPIFIAKKAQTPTAFAIETIAPDGYNGAIRLLVGLSVDQKVLGVRVLQHNETPGLGDKIDLSISDWILNFTDKTLNQDDIKKWAVRKDGGQFDQFTGATITPRAVVNAAKRAAIFVQKNTSQILDESPTCGVKS